MYKLSIILLSFIFLFCSLQDIFLRYCYIITGKFRILIYNSLSSEFSWFNKVVSGVITGVIYIIVIIKVNFDTFMLLFSVTSNFCMFSDFSNVVYSVKSWFTSVNYSVRSPEINFELLTLIINIITRSFFFLKIIGVFDLEIVFFNYWNFDSFDYFCIKLRFCSFRVIIL